MSHMRQVALLAAGCQPWNVEVVAASDNCFAYCATQAIYVYQLDPDYKEFKLVSIMSEHKKTITSIAWSKHNPDLFASSCTDNVIIIWNVVLQRSIANLTSIKSPPCSIGWCLDDNECVAFVSQRGPLYLWNYNTQGGLNYHKEAHNFTSDVCQFRWHHKKIGKLAFGHMDGSVSFFCTGVRSQKHVMRPEVMEESDEDDPVTALEWDPLSLEYLLVANARTGVRLLDSETLNVIMVFQLPSAAAQIHTLSWIHSAPGMFLTGDRHIGVMRLFSVSKATPIENIRLKKTGFHAMIVFIPGDLSAADNISNDLKCDTSSTSQATLSVISGSSYALPPAHALCTFLDGGVGLYDLARRKWDFLRDLGHVETIFDCKFSPGNPNLLATASFDGTIKVWDVSTMQAVYSSSGNEGVIYCLSWSPADVNCIAACTAKHGAFIWDLDRQKIVQRLTEHGKASIYCIAWNQIDSRRIATTGGDGFCYVRQLDGKMSMKYRHPGVVYGCDWNPHNKDMLATGCDDTNVRVYYLATNTEQPLKVFQGHTSKVFHVKWSVLKEGLLCSGSDDCTIRVWDYTSECCTMVLRGHNGPVRGLLWSTEIPYMLFSGSWDFSIRIWDSRDGACLDTVLDHGADVYGLTSHPDRPFCLASCSRDSTVRIWSVTPLVQPLEIKILLDHPWHEILANPEPAYAPGCPPLLVGRASREIRNHIDNLKTTPRSWILQHFSLFFASPNGADNLWMLVNVIVGASDFQLTDRYKSGIMHMKHITSCKSAEAQEMEMTKITRQISSIGSPKQEEKLRDVASIHIRLGNIQRYCELLVDIGDWDKALAVAPGVSMAYWKSLSERYAHHLIRHGSDQSVPYCVATGLVEPLSKFFTLQGQLHDAFLTAVAAHEGSISVPHVPLPNIAMTMDSSDEGLRLLQKTSDTLAAWQFRNGAPVLAACCHLAVDNCQKAMSKLLRGNEIELAASVGLVLGNVKELTDLALLYLARRCERLGLWHLAVELLKLTDDCDRSSAQLCMRCAASMDEINLLHTQAGLPNMEECVSIGLDHHNRGDTLKAVMYYLLSTTPEVGLEIGLAHVKVVCSGKSWTANDVFDLLQLLGSIQTEHLHKHKCSRFLPTLLAYSAYVGALVACRRGYNVIVAPLIWHAIDLMKKADDIPFSESLLSSEYDSWLKKQTNGYSMDRPSSARKSCLSIEQQVIYDNFVRKAGKETWLVETGPDTVTGSSLPSHSDVHESVITRQRIQGPAFFLEDGRSVMSISEAINVGKSEPFLTLRIWC